MSQTEPRRSIGTPPVTQSGPTISLVVAMTVDYIIGVANQLPWKLSADLKRFRALTVNHAVIMGRKTHESIGKRLPDRRNIIVTRGGSQSSIDGETASSLEEAVIRCSNDNQIFVIGGGALYRQALPLATRIFLTLIEPHEMKLPLFNQFEGDAYFPRIDPSEWVITRLGRRNVARPKGRPAPISRRSVYFRFIDLTRIRESTIHTYSSTAVEQFDLEAFSSLRRTRREIVPTRSR